MKGHWARTYRIPAYLVKLYQASLKRNENNLEMNLTYQNNDVKENYAYKNDDFSCLNGLDDIRGLDETTHLEVANFFKNHD